MQFSKPSLIKAISGATKLKRLHTALLPTLDTFDISGLPALEHLGITVDAQLPSVPQLLAWVATFPSLTSFKFSESAPNLEDLR